MSDKGRYDGRDKEAAGESRRSRWDRSSREVDRAQQQERGNNDRTNQREWGTGLTSNDEHRKWYGHSTEGKQESSNTTSNTGSRWSSSSSKTTAERPGRRRFAEAESAEEGHSYTRNFKDVDLELEEQYRRYEQERLSAGDAESNKRDYTAAFSRTDNVPGDSSEEPQAKKSGFTMTMGSGKSGAATGHTAFAQKAIGFSMSKSKLQPFDNPLASKKPVAPIKMSLGVQKPKAPSTIKKPVAIANVFNEEDDSDEEEMPPEAKMRMRNLGRETPTAAGPNSFGKGNLGFCDRHKIIQRELQKKMDEVAPQK